MSDVTKTIKDRLSIFDVVSSYIQLTQRGNSYVACCPFHNEKTPSFYVSPDRGTYHCFGCGRGGDIYSFVQDFEGVDFKEALKNLALRAGVELPKYSGAGDQEDKDQTKRLYKIIDEAVNIYESDLWSQVGTEAVKYLDERGLEKGTLKNFRVGYAQNEWRYLTTRLKSLGYTDTELVEAGLSVNTTKGLYDKFRGRVMFPIANNQGQFIGFSGRVLPQYSMFANGAEAPKYMNSPETKLYHKSQILFGYSLAKDQIRKKGRVVVVEGMVDVLMSAQSGIYETVAVAGTALTIDHAKVLRRLAEKIYVCFDADQAGINALFRVLPTLIEMDLDVYVVCLPDGKKDPADIVFEDQTLWPKLVDESKPFMDFLINYARKQHSNIKDLRNFADTQILPIVAKIVQVVSRAHAINILARAIDLPEETLHLAILQKSQKDPVQIKTNNSDKVKKPTAAEIFTGLYKLDLAKMGLNDCLEIVRKNFNEFLSSPPEEILDQIETDGHTFESYAERELNETDKKIDYVNELSLNFIKKQIEDKIGQIKNKNDIDEKDLTQVTKYTQTLDLINRQMHTNNYE